MNEDEAAKCLELSKKKYKQGDYAGALKFAQKSVKLADTIDGQSWLSFITANPSPKPSNSSTPASKSASKPSEPEEDKAARPYTPDQVKGIKRILEMKQKGDLYGIFGLEKGSSDSEIKKAYRKHALLYHPDKCGAPGTDDAFKAIGHAWTILGDPDKRANYDRFGIDSESTSRGGPPGFTNFGGAHGFEGEISPDDLLRMFMGGGGFGGTTFTFNAGPQFRTSGFARNANFRRAEPESNFGVFVQLLPVIFMFLLSFLSMLTSEDEPFSFTKTYDYSMEKISSPHSVPYYVNPQYYSRKYRTTRKQQELDAKVESEYLQHLRYKCGQEKETQAFYIRQAQNWFSVNEEKLRKAQNMPMPYCQRLGEWYTQK